MLPGDRRSGVGGTRSGVGGGRTRPRRRIALAGALAVGLLTACTPGTSTAPLGPPATAAAPPATAAAPVTTAAAPGSGGSPTGPTPSRPGPTPSGPGRTLLPTSGPLPAGTVVQVVSVTDRSGNLHTADSGQAQVAVGTGYVLHLVCRGAGSAAGLVVAVRPERVLSDGTVSRPSYGAVRCSGQPVDLGWEPVTTGPVSLLVTDTSTGGPLPGSSVLAQLRLARPGERFPAATTTPPELQPAPTLATPAPQPTELFRVTDATGEAVGQVGRGQPLVVTVACGAADPTRRAAWRLDPLTPDLDDPEGDAPVASGSAPCDGRAVRATRVSVVTGEVLLRVDPEPGPPRRWWVVVTTQP